MEKILVATDLSAHSASAIHYAYKLSQLKGASLVVVHVYHLLKPKNWRSQRFENYHKIRKDFILTKLNKFLDKILSSIEPPLINLEIELQMNKNIVTTILKCVEKHKCTYMCIGTQGTGKLEQTTDKTANKLIAKVRIPIFSVPSSFKMRPITSICYVSDMINYQREIKKILEFVKPLNIELGMLHVASSSEIIPKRTLLETRLFKRTGVEIKIRYVLRNPTNTLMEDIDIAIKKIRPSLVIFFISRSKNYLSSVLYSSHIPPLSLFKKIPILTYKK